MTSNVTPAPVNYNKLVVSGGVLQMAPDPTFPKPPAEKGYLIR